MACFSKVIDYTIHIPHTHVEYLFFIDGISCFIVGCFSFMFGCSLTKLENMFDMLVVLLLHFFLKFKVIQAYEINRQHPHYCQMIVSFEAFCISM
jgi:hypothetical protein